MMSETRAGKGIEPTLIESRLGRTFLESPLGFVDIGSLGGVHPVTSSIAALIHAFCFEPDASGFEALRGQYQTGHHPYAAVTVLQDAVAEQSASARSLHVSITPTNTSLLEPNPSFIDRYHGERFLVRETIEVQTTSLDEVAFRKSAGFDRLGEFIKLDTQGSEYEILSGAKRVLAERCVAVYCEVEFFEVYKEQKTLADIVCLLREHGLSLYGLYPHYRSAGLLDRRRFESEERLMWADAIFFKDPLGPDVCTQALGPRQIDALILAAFATRFYDFALELATKFWGSGRDTDELRRIIECVAAIRTEGTVANFRELMTGASPVSGLPDYLAIRRFLESGTSNTSTEHLWNARQ